MASTMARGTRAGFVASLALVPSVIESAGRSRGLLSRIRKTEERALPGAGA